MSEKKLRQLPFSLRVSERAMKAYKAAAKRAGMSPSEWARLVLDAAAGASDLPEQLVRVVQVREKPVRDGRW